MKLFHTLTLQLLIEIDHSYTVYKQFVVVYIIVREAFTVFRLFACKLWTMFEFSVLSHSWLIFLEILFYNLFSSWLLTLIIFSVGARSSWHCKSLKGGNMVLYSCLICKIFMIFKISVLTFLPINIPYPSFQCVLLSWLLTFIVSLWVQEIHSVTSHLNFSFQCFLPVTLIKFKQCSNYASLPVLNSILLGIICNDSNSVDWRK